MNPVSLILDGETGLLFEGRVPDTLLFVPACCVSSSEACDDCGRVFRDEEKPFTDQSSPRLQRLLERLDDVHDVAIA